MTWLPQEPNQVIRLLDAESIRKGLEFASFWLRLQLSEAKINSDEWQRFVLLTQGKAIRGAEEHRMDGWVYPRPARFWVRELKDEVHDLATYGAFSLWAAAGHPDPWGSSR